MCQALMEKKHAILVSLDLKKAYESTWKHRIIIKLIELGLKGHIIALIINFLNNRSTRVKIGQILSEKVIRENGLP